MLYDNYDRAAAFLEGPFEGLCTPSEMAEYLNIDDSTIRQAIRSGKLREGVDCLKLGKQWVLSRKAWGQLKGNYQQYSVLKTECYKVVHAEK